MSAHPKGTKVRYRQHTRTARGGSWDSRVTTGIVVGHYGDFLVIKTLFGGRQTREAAQDVIEVLSEWPQR